MPFDLSPYNVTLGGFDYPVKYSQLLTYVQDGLNTLAGFKNRIINGKMDIAQRGTSFAAVADGAYTLDRWRFGNTSAAVVTISQQADVPADNEFQNSLRVAVTTADASIAAGDTCFISQRIEGYNVRDLIGRTFTLRFRARSSKTGVHCIALRNSGLNRSYVAEYTVNAANVWENKTITVTGGLITAGTWDWTNGTGLEACFVLAAGSTFQTTAGAWQTGNFLDTANQVNCLDSNTNIFAITGVQLEPGAVDSPFEHRPFGVELGLTQRYYEKGSFSTGGAAGLKYASGSGAGWHNSAHSFSVVKRASPTVTATGTLTYENSSAIEFSVDTGGFASRVTATAAGIYRAYNTDWAAAIEL